MEYCGGIRNGGMTGLTVEMRIFWLAIRLAVRESGERERERERAKAVP